MKWAAGILLLVLAAAAGFVAYRGWPKRPVAVAGVTATLDRPRFLVPSKEGLHAYREYLETLWRSTAERTKREVDGIAASKGGREAIRFIRDASERNPVEPPQADASPWSLSAVRPSVLRTYDFAAWFRELQLVRLLPYVAEKYGGDGCVEASVDLLVSLFSPGVDPALQLAAADTLADEPVFSSPSFSTSSCHEGFSRGEGRRGHEWDVTYTIQGGIEFDFEHGGPDDPCGGAYRLSLAPFVRDNVALTEKLTALVGGYAPWRARDLVLRALPRMARTDGFAEVILGRLSDRGEKGEIKEHALEQCRPFAEDARVRGLFDRSLSHEGRELGFSFGKAVSLLPQWYPEDLHFFQALSAYIDAEASCVYDHKESVCLLVGYYALHGRDDPWTTTLTSLLRKKAESDPDTFAELTEAIGKERLKVFIPVLEDLRRARSRPEDKESDDVLRVIDDCLRGLSPATHPK